MKIPFVFLVSKFLLSQIYVGAVNCVGVSDPSNGTSSYALLYFSPAIVQIFLPLYCVRNDQIEQILNLSLIWRPTGLIPAVEMF